MKICDHRSVSKWFTIGLILICALMNCSHEQRVNNLVQKLDPKKGYNPNRLVVNNLVNIGEPAVEPLIAALEETGKRSWLIEALSRIKDERAVEPIIIILNGKNKYHATSAAKALGNIGDDRAVESLITALKDEDSSLRFAAIEALAKIGDSRALFPLFIAWTQESIAKNRTEVYSAFRQMRVARSSDIEPLILHLDGKHASVIRDKLKKNEYVAVEALVAALQNEKTSIRKEAIKLLGTLRDERAVLPLIQALEDEVTDVRILAIHTLKYFADTRSVDPLIALLKDRNWEVRREAVSTLGKLGDARAVVPLIARLKDTRSEVRGDATDSLGEIGDSRGMNPLIQRLNDPESFIRHRAAEALGKIGDIVVEPLLKIFRNEKASLPETLPVVFVSIENPPVDKLISYLKDSKPNMRLRVALVLGEMQKHQTGFSSYRGLDIQSIQSIVSALQSAFDAGDIEVVAGAHTFFISESIPGSEPTLIRAFNKYSTQQMAKNFLNCGNSKLEKTAQDWAKKRGYLITSLPSLGASGPTWKTKK